jgi:hypothetical protein
MSAWVTCPSCGARNDLARHRMFCGQCNARLDLSKIQHGASGPRRFLGGLARWGGRLVLLAVLAGVPLALWPTEPAGAVGPPDAAETCYTKLATLHGAIRAEQPARQVFGEAEANAYLVEWLPKLLADAAAAGTPLPVRQVNLTFTEADIVVHIQGVWQSLEWTISGTAQPLPMASGVDWQWSRVQLGHLPVPAAAGRWLMKRTGRQFERMEREKFVLQGVRGVDLAAQRIRLQTR